MKIQSNKLEKMLDIIDAKMNEIQKKDINFYSLLWDLKIKLLQVYSKNNFQPSDKSLTEDQKILIEDVDYLIYYLENDKEYADLFKQLKLFSKILKGEQEIELQ